MKSRCATSKRFNENISREIEGLCNGLRLLNIPFTQAMVSSFRKYLVLLYSFRTRLHLLSQRDYERISERHFVTSLMAYPFVLGYGCACDIGAGAGFPSVPLKIVLPHLRLTLYESIKKKARFLDCLVRELQLEDVEVRSERAEHAVSAQYDLVLLKAVGKVGAMLKTINALIRAEGLAVFYKTHQVEKELRAARRLLDRYGFVVEVRRLYSPTERLPLALVLLHKAP